MKNLSTGTGLALLAGATLASPFVSSLAPSANASQAGVTPGVLFRAWSNDLVEYRLFNSCANGWGSFVCQYNLDGCGWNVFENLAQGLAFRSDINFDEKVEGADLAALLNDWGDAPRQDIPPSDRPLALINP